MPQIHDLPEFVFNQVHHERNEGWCHLRVYENDGEVVAIASYKIRPDGDHDDGPDDEFVYSLTNGIEHVATHIRRDLGIKFTHLIEHVPERGRDLATGKTKGLSLDYPEEFSIVTLRWDERSEKYAEIPGVHPWQFITLGEVETLIGEVFPG